VHVQPVADALRSLHSLNSQPELKVSAGPASLIPRKGPASLIPRKETQQIRSVSIGKMNFNK
jgi:hypothetical protein